MNRLNDSHFSFKCPMNLEDMQATAHGHFCGKCKKEDGETESPDQKPTPPSE